ncbi:MAG: hypothetical protein GY847_00660 [Proteobacteria bacterium]|nr:hypothetical protein [Pseudomonadota bacterium]
MSKKKPIRQKRQRDWQKVIQQWQKSGLSVRTFCRQQGIPTTSFYQGRRRLTASALTSPRQNPQNKFIEVNLRPPPSGSVSLEIIWAKPPVVKIHPGCDLVLLRETLGLMSEQKC